MATALLKRASPSNLFAAVRSAADSIRINAVSREMQNGQPVWVKERKRGSERIIRCANLFFRLAGNPVRVWGRLDAWQRWEVDCFDMLNGDGFRAFADGPRTVRLENIPGETMCDLLTAEKLTDEMIEAAACELARVHSIHCAHLNGPWSHGDARLANFIFDEAAHRARLIDFEVIHSGSLSHSERHADDLLVFLQDLMGRVPEERWLPGAVRFVRAYGRPDVVAALARRLVIPAGSIPRLWWAIRTRYMPHAQLKRRAAALRASLA